MKFRQPMPSIEIKDVLFHCKLVAVPVGAGVDGSCREADELWRNGRDTILCMHRRQRPRQALAKVAGVRFIMASFLCVYRCSNILIASVVDTETPAGGIDRNSSETYVRVNVHVFIFSRCLPRVFPVFCCR